MGGLNWWLWRFDEHPRFSKLVLFSYLLYDSYFPAYVICIYCIIFPFSCGRTCCFRVSKRMDRKQRDSFLRLRVMASACFCCWCFKLVCSLTSAKQERACYTLASPPLFFWQYHYKTLDLLAFYGMLFLPRQPLQGYPRCMIISRQMDLKPNSLGRRHPRGFSGSRNSSVGRAEDWKSSCHRFKPGFWQVFKDDLG